jgi:hypothetical protein
MVTRDKLQSNIYKLYPLNHYLRAGNMDKINKYKELVEAAREKFSCDSKLGIKANVDGVLEFVRKETGLLDVPILQKTAVDLINDLTADAFRAISPENRSVFIPHCLRNIKECKAPCNEDGYDCNSCGKCKISNLVDLCRSKDMKCYIVGGGSQVINIVKKYRPSALIGIACFTEVKMGFDKMLEIGMPCQGVLLSRSGCINTDLNLDEAYEKINL